MASAKSVLAATAVLLLFPSPGSSRLLGIGARGDMTYADLSVLLSQLGGPLQDTTRTPTIPGTPGASTTPNSREPSTVTLSGTTTVTVSVSISPSTPLNSTPASSVVFPTSSIPVSGQTSPYTSSPTAQGRTSATAMNPETTTSASFMTSTDASSGDTSGAGGNRTLVIALSTVLSVVVVLLLVGAVLLCWRCRERQHGLFNRGITPIDDDEIATWKAPRSEKARAAADSGIDAAAGNHARQLSANSIRKPPSVIVYQSHNHQAARQSDELSRRSFSHNNTQSLYNGRMSLEKEWPQTPIQARAPNARAGLTDEAIPGADPFLPSPRRQPSRLSKQPPLSSPRSTHTRTRSSRSSASIRSYAGSEMELSPRMSHDYHGSSQHVHSRVYSTSSIPPRLSFGDDGIIGGLSPRPLFRDEEIGRAIG